MFEIGDLITVVREDSFGPYTTGWIRRVTAVDDEYFYWVYVSRSAPVAKPLRKSHSQLFRKLLPMEILLYV